MIEVYEASEKAGDVAVVLGSAIEKLSTAADKSAAVKRVVQELSQAKKASEKICGLNGQLGRPDAKS